MIVSHFQTWDDILFSQLFSIDFTIFVSQYNICIAIFFFLYKKYDYDFDLKKYFLLKLSEIELYTVVNMDTILLINKCNVANLDLFNFEFS